WIIPNKVKNLMENKIITEKIREFFKENIRVESFKLPLDKNF
ncbi:unnamed protein product, partial [marine sediment metagenome]